MDYGFFLVASDDRIFDLPADRHVMIGRSAVNQIVLNDRMVSRVHAGIAASPNGPVLTDRGSANGLQVNGLPAQESVLKHGDTVRIGNTLFQVFAGTRAEVGQWVIRRKSDTKTDKTMNNLNVNQPRPSDMLGDLSAFNIVSLMQTLSDQKQNGALTLSQSGQLRGKVFFLNGSIVWAETADGVKGKDALYQLMELENGQFVVQMSTRPPQLGIMESTRGLLLEGCRRLDEKRSRLAGV
jgi:pSer/pThr/pTyr-binding forkhead associated (FHA) protein